MIRESFDSMSPVTKAILDGSTTFKEVVEDFFTLEVAAKATALYESSSRLQRREIVRILMDGESVSLVEGVL